MAGCRPSLSPAVDVVSMPGPAVFPYLLVDYPYHLVGLRRLNYMYHLNYQHRHLNYQYHPAGLWHLDYLYHLVGFWHLNYRYFLVGFGHLSYLYQPVGLWHLHHLVGI